MATSVATPLIKQFATIAGIDSDLHHQLARLDLDRDPVRARPRHRRRRRRRAGGDRAHAARSCRSDMTTPPSYRKVNPADAPILLLALKSDIVPLTELDAFAQQVISPSLSTLDGVAQVLIFGSQKYAVRIQIDPTALAARGISHRRAADGDRRRPTPTRRSAPCRATQQQLTIDANTQLDNAADFSKLIVASQRRQAGAARRRHQGHRFGRQPRRRRAGMTARAPSSSRSSASPTPTRSTSSTASRRCCRPSQAQLPAAASHRDCSTTARPRSAGRATTCSSRSLLTIALVILVIFLFLRRVCGDADPGARRADLAHRHARRRCTCSAFPSTTSRCWR